MAHLIAHVFISPGCLSGGWRPECVWGDGQPGRMSPIDDHRFTFDQCFIRANSIGEFFYPLHSISLEPLFLWVAMNQKRQRQLDLLFSSKLAETCGAE